MDTEDMLKNNKKDGQCKQRDGNSKKRTKKEMLEMKDALKMPLVGSLVKEHM